MNFNEECALKAVSKMENEDGSRGEHWSLEETTRSELLYNEIILSSLTMFAHLYEARSLYSG